MIDISVIMTVYNGEKYIQKSITDILNQTKKSFEFIIVDDGSTDNTYNILKDFANKDSRIVLIKQENTGQGLARNKGIEKASGKYILLLDADDIFSPDLLEKLYSAAETNSSDITICKSLDFDNDTNITNKDCYAVNTDMYPSYNKFYPFDHPDFIFNFSVGWAWDKLFRLDFVKKNNIYFPSLKHSEDLVFVFGAYCYNPSIYIIDDILIHHRMNNKNSVSNVRSNSPLLFIDATKILQNIMKLQNVEQLFNHSFVNWIVQFYYWHLDTIDQKNKILVQNAINSFFKEFNFYKYDANFFYDKNLFSRLNYHRKYILCIKNFLHTKILNIFTKKKNM